MCNKKQSFKNYCSFTFALKPYFFVFILFFTNTISSAQCAMCRAALESEEGGNKAAAVNDGIVYLMAFPYLLVGIVGFVVYKLFRKNRKIVN